MSNRPATALHPGCGTRIDRAPGGMAISLARADTRWRHPWYCGPTWVEADRSWHAVVTPGFVNGRCPTVRTTREKALAAARATWYSGLVSATSGRRDIARAAELAAGGATAGETAGDEDVDMPLYQGPPLRLELRSVSGEPAPEFFRRRGVGDPPQIDGEGRIDRDALSDHQPGRLLKASDIVLHVPRAGLTSTITIEPGLATGQSNVTQRLGTRPPAAGTRLHLWSVPEFDAADFERKIDPLTGMFEEATYDELHLATVYLLSPPGLWWGTDPDHRWTPYVRHRVFWNLCWDQKILQAQRSADGLSMVVPLAAGAGQLAVNFVTAGLNDAYNMALNIIAGQSMAGRFWVATGGGADAAFPQAPSTPTAGVRGLDKDRLAEAAAAAARQKSAATETLDPPWPYRAIGFPRGLLG